MVIVNNTLEWGVCIISILLKLCLYPVPFLRYSALKNGVTLKLGPWGKGRSRSLEMAPFDRPYFIGPPLYYIKLSSTVFALLDVEKYRDLEIWVRDH